VEGASTLTEKKGVAQLWHRRGSQRVQQAAALVKRLVTTKEAAQYLGMSDWSIRQLVRSGKLPVVSGCEECNWRFDVHDLNEYVDNNKQWNADGE